MEKSNILDFIQSIRKISSNDLLIDALFKFVEDYDGSDMSSLGLLVTGIGALLIEYEELKINSDAYMEVNTAMMETSKDLEDVKMQYRALTGKFPKPTFE